MTSLATVEVVTPHRRKTPMRTLQAVDELWEPFEDAAQVAGSTRPDFLREFMAWVNDDPKLWADVRAEADRRGETMRAVVQRQLRAYLQP